MHAYMHNYYKLRVHVVHALSHAVMSYYIHTIRPISGKKIVLVHESRMSGWLINTLVSDSGNIALI